MYCTEFTSPIGPLYVISDGYAITHLLMEPTGSVNIQAENCPVLTAAVRWLYDYFRGNPREVDFPLAPEGTEFQQRVWEQLKTIPYGITCTYGDIAREIGCRSAQAVGQAVGANPIAVIIPCHRVIGAKGQLTGYAWGTEKKKWLLEQEARKKEIVL